MPNRLRDQETLTLDLAKCDRRIKRIKEELRDAFAEHVHLMEQMERLKDDAEEAHRNAQDIRKRMGVKW
jgi:predicted  nucleic acid-binding Zn-ribbon protein